MMVEAPGLFSTITDAPRAGPSFDATCRAWMSLVPPGGKGTTIRMGLPGFGKPWATAFDPCRHAHTAKADVIRRKEKIMTSSVSCESCARARPDEQRCCTACSH